jgi:hypothetical protein
MATIPAAAAAVGYDTETLGPSITVAGNWQKYNFFGTNPSNINVTSNVDGSVTIGGGGNTYNGQLATATLGSNGQVVGEAFGGGLYAQATISVPGPTYGLWSSNGSSGWPSFWSNTIEGYIGTGKNVEPDFMEMDTSSPGQFGIAMHDWSGSVSTGAVVDVPAGTDLHQSNTYGFLWVPATASTQGYAKWFFNGQQVGSTVTWNQGSNPFGDLDTGHLDLILGAGPNSPMTVSDVEVWQASSADDIGVTSTTTPPPPAPSPNGTTITSASAAPIIDASGNAWSLVQSASKGLQIAVNGTVDAITSNVVLLETLNGAIVQENAAGHWYSETTPNDSWTQIANPNPAAPPPASATVTGSGSDTLVLSISEDAYANGDGTSDANGDAAFTVSVDGKQLAGTFYATASHSAGASQNFTFKGNRAPGAHTVTVAFLNDAYAGTPSTDRNLYVNDVTYDGTDTKQSAALMSTGSQNFSVTDSTAIPPVVTGGGSDSLVVKVSEDYYLANAQFTVSVDGKQLGGTFTATTLHSSGNSQTFAFAGDFGSGQHTVSVDFLNDAWAGTPATDRNLYVNDIVYNGTDTGQSAALMTTGAKAFSVSGGTTPSVSETGDHGTLQKNLSQTGSYTVGGDTFVLGSGNAATVTLGTGTSQIKFVGPSSVALTGGAGQATVTADAGNNKFVAGPGSLDVTGGAGKDAYVFHATSGLLTLADFSLAKGDTLTIDESLQSSLHETSDGIGGVMLTFGTNTGHGVDIHGVATMPSSNILWT